MPSEVENIFLPYHKSNETLVETIDNMIRTKESIDRILEITNKEILMNNYGFSKEEVDMADRIWKKLTKRRLNRGK
jgi:adenine-specific DNA-methyltransferase